MWFGIADLINALETRFVWLIFLTVHPWRERVFLWVNRSIQTVIFSQYTWRLSPKSTSPLNVNNVHVLKGSFQVTTTEIKHKKYCLINVTINSINTSIHTGNLHILVGKDKERRYPFQMTIKLKSCLALINNHNSNNNIDLLRLWQTTKS